MSEKLEGNKKDIKPERPDTSSNRTLRRTGGEGFLFSSLLLRKYFMCVVAGLVSTLVTSRTTSCACL